jgi:predicted O-linked N-acetylglucosamine transferase (SPINDLY family)
LFKLHPDFDKVLCEILRRDPDGRIVLISAPHRHWVELLNRRFAASLNGHSDRVIYVPRMSQLDFRAMLAVCDVMLDPIHVGGGMTSLDAFVAGIPIATLPGQFMRGRFTAAWCRLLEINECVVCDAESYVNLALRLANDNVFAREIRRRIVRNCDRLFDDSLTLREFEDFFAKVVVMQPREAAEVGAPA